MSIAIVEERCSWLAVDSDTVRDKDGVRKIGDVNLAKKRKANERNERMRRLSVHPPQERERSIPACE
jgi:hypothetical protein